MTDNEIIKAFECCNNDGCENCPNRPTCCEIDVADEILNIINRQKAEIERLKDHIVDLNKKVKHEAYKEFADKLAGAFNKDINLYGRCTLSDVALKINTTLKELTDQTATNHSVSLIDGHIEG